MNIYKWAVYYYEESETACHHAYGLVAGESYSDATQRVINEQFNGRNDIIESIKLYDWGPSINSNKEALKTLEESVIW